MNIKLFTLSLASGMMLMGTAAHAGNKDRSGQAGATQLLNNPWANSTGAFGLDAAHIKGATSMKVNMAGLARGSSSEIAIGYNEHLIGTQTRIVNAAYSQQLGGGTAFGINVMSTNVGEIEVTTVDQPEGAGATFKPNIFNASAGFAKTFSDRIHVGVGVTFISEGVNDAKSSAASLDAGIQYVTGKRDNFHFGIALRNVGTYMRFSGDGFNSQTDVDGYTTYTITRQTPSAKAELPTQLTFGLSYDFYLDENRLESDTSQPKHRLTAMGNFTSNSFFYDYIGLGLEYGFKERFFLRTGYRYEKEIFNAEKAQTFYTGFSAGASIVAVNSKGGSKILFDYSFRPTRKPNNGCHGIGVRFMWK